MNATANNSAALQPEVEAGLPRPGDRPGIALETESIAALLVRRKIEPWMLAETFEEQMNWVHAHGGWLLAFEKLTEATPELQERADFDALYAHKVRRVGRYGDGRIYCDEIKSAYTVLKDLKTFAAGCVARDALKKLQTARWKRQWARERKAKAVSP